jgi:hypothetical protein
MNEQQITDALNELKARVDKLEGKKTEKTDEGETAKTDTEKDKPERSFRTR